MPNRWLRVLDFRSEANKGGKNSIPCTHKRVFDADVFVICEEQRLVDVRILRADADPDVLLLYLRWAAIILQGECDELLPAEQEDVPAHKPVPERLFHVLLVAVLHTLHRDQFRHDRMHRKFLFDRIPRSCKLRLEEHFHSDFRCYRAGSVHDDGLHHNLLLPQLRV